MKRCKFPWIHQTVEIPFNAPDGSMWQEKYCYVCGQADFYRRYGNGWVLSKYPSGEIINKQVPSLEY